MTVTCFRLGLTSFRITEAPGVQGGVEGQLGGLLAVLEGGLEAEERPFGDVEPSLISKTLKACFNTSNILM